MRGALIGRALVEGLVTSTEIVVGGMTCGGCSSRLSEALAAMQGVSEVDVCHKSGLARIESSDNVGHGAFVETITAAGFTVGAPKFDWSDRAIWKESANNTKWCLVGCSIGEFGTLAYYSYSGITADLELFSNIWYFYAILPLINGLITSVMLETAILMRGQMDFRNALSTALGMSFISMLMMEIAMEVTDLLFTSGELGMNPIAIPFMLVVGFLTPWPYNYWRLKKYGKACH